MAKTTDEERLAALRAKTERLEAQIASIESRKAKKQKADEERRAFLSGQLVWKQGREDLQSAVTDLAKEHLTSNADRALFGLDPK